MKAQKDAEYEQCLKDEIALAEQEGRDAEALKKEQEEERKKQE